MGGMGTTVLSTSKGIMTDLGGLARRASAAKSCARCGRGRHVENRKAQAIPSGVTVVVDDARVRVKGLKGELSLHVLTSTTVTVEIKPR